MNLDAGAPLAGRRRKCAQFHFTVDGGFQSVT